MKLVLLGTTGYHPNDRRHTLCLLIPECGIMLDAGTAVYRAGRYLETSELTILLTHAHLDHVIGLTYLFNVVRAHPLDRIIVRGGADCLAAVDKHLFSGALFPKKPPMEFRPLGEGEETLPSGGRLTFFPLEHHGGSLGYRLDWPGHSLAYVTDTTASPDAEYVQKIRGVDLLVHECYFADAHADWAKQTGHSWTTAVAQVAREARARRLVLVHFDPLSTDDDPIGLDVARAIFPSTEIGEDLMELEF
ncbi:MAG: metal-dependent hydrolase [Planctomycetes bacterium RBG_16_64_12]|nr:MAG: metal-dependent hydrolase [Planctomycetes bacterium RBG_16_64_12]